MAFAQKIRDLNVRSHNKGLSIMLKTISTRRTLAPRQDTLVMFRTRQSRVFRPLDTTARQQMLLAQVSTFHTLIFDDMNSSTAKFGSGTLSERIEVSKENTKSSRGVCMCINRSVEHILIESIHQQRSGMGRGEQANHRSRRWQREVV